MDIYKILYYKIGVSWIGFNRLMFVSVGIVNCCWCGDIGIF